MGETARAAIAAERVNDLGNPLQKWAHFRKPNAIGEARADSATSPHDQTL
jgi:hypothetical protein